MGTISNIKLLSTFLKSRAADVRFDMDAHILLMLFFFFFFFFFWLQIWYRNIPHTKLAVVKGGQNWVKVSGEYLTFPGGGTQFKHGALHYIDFIQEVIFQPALFHCTISRVL